MIINFNLIKLVKDRPALVAAAVLGFIMVAGLLLALNPKPSATSNAKLYTNQNYQPTVSYVRKVPPVTRIGLEAAAASSAKPIPAVSIHVDHPVEPPPLSNYAPFGRLICCQLVITVDSGAEQSPIIGLVTDDVFHAGKKVVTAGSTIHGMAKLDALRDRIICNGPWILVRQSGEELVIHGIALDRESSSVSGSFSLTDGSVGLFGEVIRSQSNDEIKLFATSFLSGMASGLQQQQNTVLGVQIPGTIRNSGLSGTANVLNTYAQQIAEAIKKQGVFVRVPAGKQFYVYVTETLDLSQEKIGNLRAVTRRAEEAKSLPQSKSSE